MATIGQFASSTSKLSGGLLGKIFRFKWTYYFIVILLIQAVSTGLNNGGGFEVLRSLGERFLGMSQELQSTSLKIIEDNAQFDGFWDLIKTLWVLISSIWLISLWLKLFSNIWAYSPFSNESNKFINWTLGALFFLIVQIFYLFLFSEPLDGQSKFDLFVTPIMALWDFGKAVILIFSSIGFKERIMPLIDESNLSNVCLNPSGCVV